VPAVQTLPNVLHWSGQLTVAPQLFTVGPHWFTVQASGVQTHWPATVQISPVPVQAPLLGPQFTETPQLFVFVPQTAPAQVALVESAVQTHCPDALHVRAGAVVQRPLLGPQFTGLPQLFVFVPQTAPAQVVAAESAVQTHWPAAVQLSPVPVQEPFAVPQFTG
jgi:hypothetical protein